MSRDIDSDNNQSLNHTRDSNKHIPLPATPANGTHTPPPLSSLPSNGHGNGTWPQAALTAGVDGKADGSRAPISDTVKSGQYPQADIDAVSEAYLIAAELEYANEAAQRALLRSHFYKAKDLLALANGDVELAKLAITNLTKQYKADKILAGKWDFGYVVKDFPHWNKTRLAYEQKKLRAGK